MFSRRSGSTSTTGYTEFPLWGQGWPNFEVAGESHHSSSIAALFSGQIPDSGAETNHAAHLVAEPTNRYDPHAVQVVIGGHLVGYLPKDSSKSYQPIVEDLRSRGLVATLDARIWARPEIEYGYDRRGNPTERRTGRLHARVTLALAEPHLIAPLNASPGGAEIPPGRALKLAGDASVTEACAPWLRPEGEASVYVSLHRVEETLARSTREVVEGRIDNVPVGRLSPAMSQNFLPLIEQLDQRGVGCTARAVVKGNLVKAEVSVRALKASELSAAWLDQNVYSEPIIEPTPTPAVPAAKEEAATSTHPPAGWYPDPEEIAPLRYWDGTDWTTRIKMG